MNPQSSKSLVLFKPGDLAVDLSCLRVSGVIQICIFEALNEIKKSFGVALNYAEELVGGLKVRLHVLWNRSQGDGGNRDGSKFVTSNMSMNLRATVMAGAAKGI